jgi:vacuolar-type H+-ATPase subunit F/Vma7
VHLTVEKENTAYSLFLTSEYASFSETYFNHHIGYDEREIFEEENYEIVALTTKIANYMDEKIVEIKREEEYLMSLEDGNR